MSDTTGEPVERTVSFKVRPRTTGNGTRANARGSSGDDRQASFIDPTTAGTAAGEPSEPGERPKRRGGNSAGGSPGGTTGGTKATGTAPRTSLDLSAAAGLLQGFHAIIATRRGPHWLLNDQDAKAYGIALSNAMRHLPITAAQKTIDFAALAVAVCAYEGPRIAVDMHIKAQRRAGPRPAPGPAQVFQFRTPQPAPPPVQPVQVQPAQPPPSAMGPQDMSYEPDLGIGA